MKGVRVCLPVSRVIRIHLRELYAGEQTSSRKLESNLKIEILMRRGCVLWH
jgi:hypothetical protein